MNDFAGLAFNQFLTLGVIFFYLSTDINLIRYTLTLDGIFSAIDTFKKIYPRIEQYVPGRYYSGVPTYQRYIYYSLIFLLHYGLRLYLFNYLTIITYYLCGLMIHPIVVKIVVCDHRVIAIIDRIVDVVDVVKKHVLSYIVSWNINNLCFMTIKHDPMISIKEAAFLMKNQSLSDAKLLIKVFIITGIINNIRHKFLHRHIIQYAYNQGKLIPLKCKFEDIAPFINNKIDKIRRIVSTRDWKQFYNPQVLLDIADIYTENDEPAVLLDLLKKVWNATKVHFSKTAALWTIYDATKIPELMLIMPILFNLNRSPNSIDNIIKYAIKIVFGLYGYKTNNYILCSILTEFGEFLDNSVTRKAVQSLYVWIKNNKILLTHNKKHNKTLVCSMVLCYFVPIMSVYKILIGMIICYLIDDYYIMYSIIIGIASNYNFIHLLLTNVILYLAINLKDYHNIVQPVLPDDLIHSHYINSVSVIEPAEINIIDGFKLITIEDYTGVI